MKFTFLRKTELFKLLSNSITGNIPWLIVGCMWFKQNCQNYNHCLNIEQMKRNLKKGQCSKGLLSTVLSAEVWLAFFWLLWHIFSLILSHSLCSLLKVHLQLRGFSVFLDIERLRAGKFDVGLLKSVQKARNFILVLTPQALDRCLDDNDRKDWVHRVRYTVLSFFKKIM